MRQISRSIFHANNLTPRDERVKVSRVFGPRKLFNSYVEKFVEIGFETRKLRMKYSE